MRVASLQYCAARSTLSGQLSSKEKDWQEEGLTCDSSKCAIKHLSYKARDMCSQAHSYHVQGVK